MENASLTAELAAMVRAFACHVPELKSIFHDPFAHHFTGPRVLRHYLVNRISYAIGGSGIFTRGMPAVGVMCALCRHQYFEEVWMKSKKDGFDQLVLIGAGYDTKSIRNQTDNIFELDHPATQQRKQKILASKNLPGSSILIPCDLSLNSADAALDKTSFRRDVPSVLIAEGVFSYLYAPRVHALLHELSLSAKKLRLIFDYRTPAMTNPSASTDAKKVVLIIQEFRRAIPLIMDTSADRGAP